MLVFAGVKHSAHFTLFFPSLVWKSEIFCYDYYGVARNGNERKKIWWTATLAIWNVARCSLVVLVVEHVWELEDLVMICKWLGKSMFEVFWRTFVRVLFIRLFWKTILN